MLMKRKVLLITLAACAVYLHSAGEEKQQKDTSSSLHHAVIVTATRIETPARELASSVSVITQEDLGTTRKATLLEALQDIVGLAVLRNGPVGSASSVFLRGANSEHTLILLDGVELNDPISPSHSFDLAHVLSVNVRQVEVIRGPQSTLYGSDAIGGVVNIITRKGEGPPRFSLSTSGGSYGTFENTADVNGSRGTVDYSFGLSHMITTGFSAASAFHRGNSEKDGYRNLTLSGRLGFSPRENLELGLIFRAVSAETDLDNFGGDYGDDPNNTQDYDSVFLRGQFRALLWKNRWEQKIGLSLVRSSRKHRNLTDDSHPLESERGRFKGQMVKLDWQNNLFLHTSNTLTFGLDLEQEQGDSEYVYSGIWGDSESLFPLKRAGNIGLYVQERLGFSGRFNALLGLRIDSHTEAGASITYRLAPAYFILRTGTKFKATLGTGFKAPSLYQLYAPRTIMGPVGNRDLKPERSRGLDFGAEQSFWKERLLLGVTFFYNTYDNLINFEFDRGYINIGRAESKGVEITLEARLSAEVLLKTSYTRLEARDKDNNTDLLRRPKDKFAAGLTSHFRKRWTFSLSFLHTGERKDIDFSIWPSPEVTLSSYNLLDAALSIDLNPHLQLFGRLDNILDEKYEFVWGYGTARFSAFGGLKLTF